MANEASSGTGELHPIGVVAARTGLTSHAVRAWEKRYGVVEPQRSEGGHRLYSDADIRRLRLLHRLTLRGRRIGQIADLPDDELERLLREDEQAEASAPGAPRRASSQPGLRKAAMEAVERFDAEALDALFRRAVLSLSAAGFVEELLVPLMENIGQAWRDGSLTPAHEHMASAVVVRVTGWLMDSFEAGEGAPAILLATPQGQVHELGALSAAAVGAAEGWRIVYLGADLPAEEIAGAAERTGVRAVGLSLVYPEGDPDVADEIRRLRAGLPDHVTLLVGGAAAHSYRDTLDAVGATLVGTFHELRGCLRDLDRDRDRERFDD